MKTLCSLAILLACLTSLGCGKSGDNAIAATTTSDESASQPDSTPSSDAAADGDVADRAAPSDADSAAAADTAADDTVPAPAGKPDDQTDWLLIGDPAPPLEIAHWAVGEPVEAFRDGQVYVVEFWATWCRPCRESMPHLSDLQRQYADDVTCIGVSNEPLDSVNEFLDKPSDVNRDVPWREIVAYNIAADANNATSMAYLQAARQGGIPAAFIVGRDGHVEWIGHPMGMDEPLANIVDGTWDRESAKAEQRQQVVLMEASPKIAAAMQSGDFDAALAVLQPIIDEFPDAGQLKLVKVKLLEDAGRHEQAGEVLGEVARQNWDNAGLLNELAWRIATSKNNPERDLDHAREIAERSVELTNQQDGSALDTLARVYYELGDLETALKWQRQAAEVEGPYLEDIKRTLEKYEEESASTN